MGPRLVIDAVAPAADIAATAAANPTVKLTTAQRHAEALDTSFLITANHRRCAPRSHLNNANLPRLHRATQKT